MEKRMHPVIWPHVAILVVLGVIAGILAVAMSSYLSDYSFPIMVLGAILIFIILIAIARSKYHQLATEYVINDEELTALTGVWAKDEEHVPLDKIEDFKVTRTFIQAMFGLASIEIETAAEETSYEIVFENLGKSDADWLIGFISDNVKKKE